MVLLAVTGRGAGVVTLLLTGFILSSFFLSIAGLMTSIAQDDWALGRAVVAWLSKSSRSMIDPLGAWDGPAKGSRH